MKQKREHHITNPLQDNSARKHPFPIRTQLGSVKRSKTNVTISMNLSVILKQFHELKKQT